MTRRFRHPRVADRGPPPVDRRPVGRTHSPGLVRGGFEALNGRENLRSPGVLAREAAWFARFTVFGVTWSWYSDRRVERATRAVRLSCPGGTAA
jgi:hypothetical protein